MIRAVCFVLIFASGIAAAQAGPRPVEKMSCAEIGAELVALTGGMTENLAHMQELMASGQSDILGQTLTGMGIGALGAALPGPAGKTAANVAAHAQAAKAEAQRQAAPKRQAELQALEGPREAGLERMLALHEAHEARCGG